MKTIRNIAPALLIVAVLVALALGIGLMSRDGRRQPDTTPTEDTPNAALSNSELVNKAVTNMRGLSSYRMEFNGLAPLSQGDSAQMKLLADVQSPQADATTIPGSRYKFTRGEYRTDRLDLPAVEFELIWASDGHWYESGDGGKTGTRSEYAGLFYPYLTCCWYWDGFWNSLEATPTKPAVAFSTPSSGASPSPGESSEATPDQFPPPASTTLVFEDGNPRLEKIDGVTTKHLIADVTGAWTQISIWAQSSSGATSVWDWPEPPATLELWITMDEMPTVRKMTATGSASKGNIGTWTWSRFNEDFGEIPPPANETVTQP